MTFVSQTRMQRTANLTTRQPLANPVDVARFAGVVRSVEEAMSYVPPAQRPDVDVWGGFELVYDLRCSIEVQVLGMRRNALRRVLVFFAVWQTQADREGGQPPVVRESLEMGFARRLSRNDVLNAIRQAIRDRIERIALNGGAGDLRDLRLVALADQADDEGMLADVRSIETTREIDTATTNPSNAPLLTMEPK